MRIALIHATPLAMAPVSEALARLWPEAEPMHLLDDRLSVDRARGLPQEATDARIAALGRYALQGAADGILYTCSAFGPAIEAFAATAHCPVLKPNDAMFREAMASENPGLLASFNPSIAPMTAEFAEITDTPLNTAVAEGAMEALAAGRPDDHDQMLAAAAERDLSGCDTIMLAQFSTARARTAVAAATGRRILTSPDSAVRALKAALT